MPDPAARLRLRDRINLEHARLEAQLAVCTRRQVGAVIVAGTPPRIIGSGYNGTAPGQPHCSPEERGCPRGLLTTQELPPGTDYNLAGGCKALHAEHNAVLSAGPAACRGATLYVTDVPCGQCAVLIQAVGIARVVLPGDI